MRQTRLLASMIAERIITAIGHGREVPSWDEMRIDCADATQGHLCAHQLDALADRVEEIVCETVFEG